MKISLRPAAERDYLEVCEYARFHYPGLAAGIIDRIDDMLDQIARSPRSFPEVDPPFVLFPGMRFSYLPRVGRRVIYFLIRDHEIDVVGILHGSMDTRAIFGDTE